MPKIIKDETGQEVEVYTKDELEEATKKVSESATKTAAEEAINKFKEEYKEILEKGEKYDGELKALNERIREFEEDEDDKKPDNPNDFDSKLEKVKEELFNEVKKIGETLNTTRQQTLEDQKKAAIDTFAKGDPEIQKQIDLEFDNYMPGKESAEDIVKRVSVAAKIVSERQDRPDILDNAGGKLNSGNARDSVETGKGKIDDKVKTQGKALGLTEKDYDNFNNSKKEEFIEGQRSN